MLPVNNLIFDSTVAADGAWRNVSNFTSISIQIIGAEDVVWIEATNDPTVVGDTPSGNAGVNVSGSLPSGSPTPLATGEITIFVSGGNILWSPSCLVWNYVRVRKDNVTQSVQTKAYLFGQNG